MEQQLVIRNIQRVMQALGKTHTVFNLSKHFEGRWEARKVRLDIIMDLRSSLSHTIPRFWKHYEAHLAGPHGDEMVEICEHLAEEMGHSEDAGVGYLETLLPMPEAVLAPAVKAAVNGTTFDRATGISRKTHNVRRGWSNV